MLIRYLQPLLWAVVLALSLLGWGRILRLVLRVSKYCPPGLDISLGMVVAVAVGGGLNLASLAFRPVLLGFIVVGAFVGLAYMKPLVKWILFALGRDGSVAHRQLRACYLCLTSLILIVTAFAAVRADATSGKPGVGRFNPHDDFHAYIVYPERMLQTGTIGADPFNERRLNTGLGGQNILLAMALAGMPFESLHLMEPGIGTLAALLALLALCSVLGLGWGSAIAVLLVAVVYPLRIANVSALTTGVALLLLLAVLFTQWPLGQRASGGLIVLTGLTVGAACALKTTSLMPVAGFVALFFIYRIYVSRMNSDVFWETVGVGLVAVGTLVPWMVSLYRSSGTLLFPILGSGFIGEAKPPYALLSKRAMIRIVLETVTDAPAVGVAIVGAALIWSGVLRSARGQTALAFCAAALAWLAVAGGTLAGVDPIRYAQGAISCAIVVGIAVLIAESRNAITAPRVQLSLILGISGAALAAGGVWKEARAVAAEYAKSVLGSWKAEPFDVPAYRDRYRAMQKALEHDASILVRLERPFLLNFREQRIFVVDWPGGASLPPGLPLRRGPDALANYLRGVQIHYIAYDYAHEAGFSRRVLGSRIDLGQNAWVRSFAENTFAFQDLLDELGRRYEHVYDDGELWAIDLRRPLAVDAETKREPSG